MYSPVVHDHFYDTRRVGPLEGATHRGTAGVPGEGPYVVLWLQVAGGTVEKAAYQTYGCPAAVASASMIAELVEGRRMDEVVQLRESDIVDALGGLPEGKEHCPKLAVRALQVAIESSVESSVQVMA